MENGLSTILNLATRLFDKGLVEAFIEIQRFDETTIVIASAVGGGFKQIDPPLVSGIEIQFFTEQQLHDLFDETMERDNG